MRNTKLSLALISTILFMAAVANAKTVTVLPFHGDSVHPQIRDAAREALSIFLADNGVTVRGNEIEAPVKSRAAASTAAQTAKVEYYIEGRITRLGHRAIVQVSEFKINQDDPVYSDRMTAQTPSDLEPVMQRLARSLATKNRAQVNEDIHTVTRREQKRLKRKKSNQYFGLTLGGTLSSVNSTEFLPAIGAAWLWDNRNYLFGMDLRLGGFGTNTMQWEAAMAGYIPLSQADTTPYVGGGLSLGGIATEQRHAMDEYGYEETETVTGSGLSLFGAAGVLVGRTSDVSIRPEIAYSVGTYTVDANLVHGLRIGFTLGF